MALSIKSEEADRLARHLSQITGESMTEVVTVALRKRVEEQRASSARKGEMKHRLDDLSWRMFQTYVSAPLTKAEQDEYAGDTEIG